MLIPVLKKSLTVLLAIGFCTACGGSSDSGSGGVGNNNLQVESDQSVVSGANGESPDANELEDGMSVDNASNENVVVDSQTETIGNIDSNPVQVEETVNAGNDDESDQLEQGSISVSDETDNPPMQDQSGLVQDVATDASPLSGLQGIELQLDENNTLYLLGEKQGSRDIISNPNYTDGEMKTAIGGAFYQFSQSAGVQDKAVLVTTENIRTIYMCNKTESLCRKVPVWFESNNAMSFTPLPNWHYVFVRGNS